VKSEATRRDRTGIARWDRLAGGDCVRAGVLRQWDRGGLDLLRTAPALDHDHRARHHGDGRIDIHDGGNALAIHDDLDACDE
jgi:hypothetical protein